MRGRRSTLTLSTARGLFRPIPVLFPLALSAHTGLAADKEPLAGAPTAREEVEVRLSTLEVFVLDRLGRPIYGLGASDFELLERTVVRSGGRVVTLQSIDQSALAFEVILEEIRGQYVLGYYPNQRKGDGAWHKIRVRVGGDHKARARAGYYDF